jgi:subtilisin family serine protease
MAVAKISLELKQQMNVLANQARIPVIVRFRPGTGRQAALATGAAGPQQSFNLMAAQATELTSASIDALSRQPEVERIWPDLPVQAWLNTSVPLIGAPTVWQAGVTGRGIKVAVLDTGIDETHSDFAGRIVTSKSFIGGSARDDNGHGTHVAGIIGGSGARSNGRYKGVAPECSLYIGKVLRVNGVGSMSTVMAGIEWAVLDQKVDVINLSLGGATACDGTDALSVLCDEAVQQSGVVMVVAAGNMGPDHQTIGPPGCARHVITVGATDDNNRVAAFSSRGPTADGRIKPDLVFPGVGVVAPQASGTRLGLTVASGYVISSGTSMAAPHAAGVATLMLQANPNLTAVQVKARLVAGASHVGALPNEQGVGRGDAYWAYRMALT